jgi:hypothetical protein
LYCHPRIIGTDWYQCIKGQTLPHNYTNYKHTEAKMGINSTTTQRPQRHKQQAKNQESSFMPKIIQYPNFTSNWYNNIIENQTNQKVTKQTGAHIPVNRVPFKKPQKKNHLPVS